MAQTKVADLTVDELKSLIQEAVMQTITDILQDPDEGLELREDITNKLRRSLAAAQTGTQGTPMATIAARLGLEA